MIFDDRNPPLFNNNKKKIKDLIKYKNQIYKDTSDRKSNQKFQFHFWHIENLINTNINQVQRKYFKNMSRKISDKSLDT